MKSEVTLSREWKTRLLRHVTMADASGPGITRGKERQHAPGRAA